MSIEGAKRRYIIHGGGINKFETFMNSLLALALNMLFYLIVMILAVSLIDIDAIDRVSISLYNFGNTIPSVLLSTYVGFVAIYALLYERNGKWSFGITSQDVIVLLAVPSHLVYLLIIVIVSYISRIITYYFYHLERFENSLYSGILLYYTFIAFMAVFSYDTIRIIGAVFTNRVEKVIYSNFYKYFQELHLSTGKANEWEESGIWVASEFFLSAIRNSSKAFKNIEEVEFNNNHKIQKDRWKVLVEPFVLLCFVSFMILFYFMLLILGNFGKSFGISLLISIIISLILASINKGNALLRVGGIDVGYRFCKTNGKYVIGSVGDVPIFHFGRRITTLNWIRSLLALFKMGIDNKQYYSCRILVDSLVKTGSCFETNKNGAQDKTFQILDTVFLVFCYFVKSKRQSENDDELKMLYKYLKSLIKEKNLSADDLFVSSLARALVYDTDRNKCIVGDELTNECFEKILKKTIWDDKAYTIL